MRGYAPKGKRPEIRLLAKKSHISMISSITNEGKTRFMMYQGAMNATLLIKFMSRLVKDTDRKVFLILDNLRTHHSKKVKNWLEKHKDQIETFHLPSYSPELNPDEYLNSNLKRFVNSGELAKDLKGIKKKTRSFMTKLNKNPENVSSWTSKGSLCSLKLLYFIAGGIISCQQEAYSPCYLSDWKIPFKTLTSTTSVRQFILEKGKH